jgi:hypothetical protein
MKSVAILESHGWKQTDRWQGELGKHFELSIADGHYGLGDAVP